MSHGAASRAGVLAAAALATVALAMTAGCDRGRSGSAPGASGRPPDSPAGPSGATAGTPLRLPLLRPADLTAAERRHGHGPRPDPSVVYQPEVVIVEGGAAAVRSLAGNGLGCTIDARAANAAALRPGRIALVTSRCVGRVLAVQEQAGQLALILGPVELTEIIREGDFQLDQPLDLENTLTFEAPEWPGAAARPVSVAEAVAPARLIPAGYIPPRLRRVSDAPVGGSTPLLGKRMIGALIPVSAQGVKFLGFAQLNLQAPRVHFVLQIRGATVTRCELEVHGAAGLAMGFEAGTETHGNVNTLRDLPLDVTIPVGGPVPFSVLLRQSYTLTTFFSSQTAFLRDHGEYTFEGAFSLGYRDGSWRIAGPTRLSIKDDPLARVSGAALGPSGLAFNHQLRVMVGIGAFGFATGPYTALTSGIHVSRYADAGGKPLGPPTVRGLARCRQVTLEMLVGVGIGYKVPQPITDAINSILSALNVNHRIGSSGGLEAKPRTIVHTARWTPDLDVCRLGQPPTGGAR